VSHPCSSSFPLLALLCFISNNNNTMHTHTHKHMDRGFKLSEKLCSPSLFLSGTDAHTKRQEHAHSPPFPSHWNLVYFHSLLPPRFYFYPISFSSSFFGFSFTALTSYISLCQLERREKTSRKARTRYECVVVFLCLFDHSAFAPQRFFFRCLHLLCFFCWLLSGNDTHSQNKKKHSN
jgi:hypothetical protein